MKRYLGAALAPCLLALAPPAHAVSCGVTGSTSQSIGTYNPFTGGISQTTAHLTLTRRTAFHAATAKVDFVLLRPTNAPAGLDIRYQGQSVLRSSPAGVQLSVNSPPSGTVYYNFGSYQSSDTVTLDFVVTIPAGLDLQTGQSLSFDMVYVCSGSGSVTNVNTPTTLAQAITLKLNVLGALQASYAGPALNFGEIGNVSNADANSHSVSGSLRVASSGPYYLSMSAANTYRMTYPGGNPATSAQSVRFTATLLGQTRSNASPTFYPVYCAAAGIAGETIPISVRLQDGGAGKNPSPDYRDTLTITVTPSTVLAWPPATNC